MTTYTVVTFEEKHIPELSTKIRQADIDEMLAVCGHTSVVDTLKNGLSTSVEAYVCLLDSVPICVFGITPASILSSQGVPWMLGTDELEAQALSFLHDSKALIGYWARRWSRLENYVDARNVKAIAWLRWLGFEVEPAAPYGVLGMPFHRFVMEDRRV